MLRKPFIDNDPSIQFTGKTSRLYVLVVVFFLAAAPVALAGKPPAKHKASLKRVTLEVSTIDGERPSHVQLDAVVQYGEATVSYAKNIGEGGAITAGQSATFDLPVDYALPREYAERGPDLCFIAKSFAGKERWRFKARIDLAYSDGKIVTFSADGVTLDTDNQSRCTSFWHD